MDQAQPTPAQKAVIEFSRRLGCGNGAVRKYGAKLLGRLREGPIDYDYHGLTLRLDPTLCGSVRVMLMTPDWHDCQERAFVEQHLPPKGVFFDIGANAGFYTFFAAARRPHARVIAFEPVPGLAHALKRNVAANHLRNVKVEDVALSDVDGRGMVEGEMRPTMTLLQAAKSHGVSCIDCLKIDIEGMEDQVLLAFFREAPKSLWPRAIVGEHIFTPQWRDKCLELGYREQWQSRFNSALTLD